MMLLNTANSRFLHITYKSPLRCTIHRAIRLESTVMLSLSNNNVQSGKKRVVVVGAGFAGISCARTVLQEGAGAWEVVLLEAGHRIGGRAWSADVGENGFTEFGATWLHGIVGNPLYKHAVDFGLLDTTTAKGTNWGKSQYVRHQDASPLDTQDLVTATTVMDAFEEGIEAANETRRLSVGHHLQESWEKMLSLWRGQWSSSTIGLAASVWRGRELLQRAIDGCHTTGDMSAEGLAEYQEFPGPHTTIPAGFQTLAERLADGLDVQLGHSVRNVEWGATGVVVHCDNGARFAADAGVITVSIGVLQACHQSLFTPALPEDKLQAINRLGFGVVDKMVMVFPDELAFRPEASLVPDPHSSSFAESLSESLPFHSYTLLHPVDPAVGPLFEPGPPGAQQQPLAGPSGRGPVATTEALIRHQPAGSSAGVVGDAVDCSAGPLGESTEAMETGQCRAHGGPVECDSSARGWDYLEPQEWTQGVYSLHVGGHGLLGQKQPGGTEGSESGAVSSKSTGHCALLWLTGAHAVAMEKRSEDDLMDDVSQLLTRFPGIKTRGNSNRPVAVYRSTWGSDPKFRGSYSYISADATPEDVETLSQPLMAPAVQTDVQADVQQPRPVVLFCGEATHRTYFGTTHGAYLTGQREAHRLLRSFREVDTTGTVSVAVDAQA